MPGLASAPVMLLIKHRPANAHPEAAIRQILEYNVLVVPEFFQSLQCRATRLCFTLLQFMDRALGQSDVTSKFGLAPA